MIKKFLMFASLALAVGVIGLFSVGEAYAQSPTPDLPTESQTPWGYAWGRVCQGAGVVSDAITELLGMTQEEIYAERTAGKTLSEIAAEKGVSDQQLIDAMLAGQQEVIAQAVADGRLTQEQADWMLAKMEAMAPYKISNPFGPGGMHAAGGMTGGMRGGRHGGWGGTVPVTPTP
jgi:hypothetical protein